MTEINAIQITSDPNILTYISSKGIYTNSINLIDHIKYHLNNNYLIVDEIDMLKSNYSIIPEYQKYNNIEYPVKEVNITLPETSKEVIHYIKFPDTIEKINIITNTSNYQLTINVPCKTITNNISENIIVNEIVRECEETIFNKFIFKNNSRIINLSYFDNSYFIYPNVEVINNIINVEGIAPTEEYENLKILKIVRDRYYYDKQNLCYIKQYYNSLVQLVNKKLEGLTISISNNQYIIRANNQTIKSITISNPSLKKITVNYENVYYISDNNKITKISLMDNIITEKTFITSNFSNISLFKDVLYVIDNNKLKKLNYEDGTLTNIEINYDHIITFYDMIYFKQYIIIYVLEEHNDYAYNSNYEQIDNYVKYITIYYSYDGNYFQRKFLFNIPITGIINVSSSSDKNMLYMKVEYTNEIKNYEFNSFKQREYLLRI